MLYAGPRCSTACELQFYRRSSKKKKKKKNFSGIQLVLRESSDDAPNLAGRSFHHQMSAIFGDEHFKVLTRDGVYSKTNHWVQHGL